MSSFSGLSTALSALQTTRKAMDVTGNNIANVATAGYTRQRVELTSVPSTAGRSLVDTGERAGNGVAITGITRMASTFWDAQVRSQTSLHADLASRADTLTGLEDLTGEPSDTALSGKLSRLWSSFANLTSNPTKDAAKGVVVSAAQDVVSTLRSSYTGVVGLWNDQRTAATSIANEVNAASSAVAALNRQIQTAVAAGSNANELMDQRDQLVVRLAELTGATTVPAPNGVVDVYLGANALVQGGQASAVRVVGPTSTASLPPLAGGTPTSPALQFVDGTPASVRGGQLAGVLDALGANGTLSTAASRYDAVAASLATTANAAYAAAFDPTAVPTPDPVQPFFTGSTASGATGLAVAVTVSGATALRTGSSALGAADASVALAMSKLGKGAGSPDATWSLYVSQLGADAAGAVSRTTAAASTLASSVAAQQSETGVSLDEETANLLTLQRAYQAAARVLTAVDEALDTLINNTGLVGR